ncbi:hypothetical protein BOTBODRAFT_583492 [Botryobasidium botryosum FD-172 SS1]|uniref:Uncharacterized protein n=1 Tax=Botryobasidium botryosum (strain FD-172 SS1) TaxID=930990 RepID=A0A067MQG4_BOTB1|nr:hypothetical protein BOTBODRAFT_583492 [Botryobasidium botryosum FD-172 SS1]
MSLFCFFSPSEMAERLTALSTFAFANHLATNTTSPPLATPPIAQFPTTALPGSVEELAIVNNFLVRLGEEIATGTYGQQHAAPQSGFFDPASLANLGLANIPGVGGNVYPANPAYPQLSQQQQQQQQQPPQQQTKLAYPSPPLPYESYPQQRSVDYSSLYPSLGMAHNARSNAPSGYPSPDPYGTTISHRKSHNGSPHGSAGMPVRHMSSHMQHPSPPATSSPSSTPSPSISHNALLNTLHSNHHSNAYGMAFDSLRQSRGSVPVPHLAPMDFSEKNLRPIVPLKAARYPAQSGSEDKMDIVKEEEDEQRRGSPAPSSSSASLSRPRPLEPKVESLRLPSPFSSSSPAPSTSTSTSTSSIASTSSSSSDPLYPLLLTSGDPGLKLPALNSSVHALSGPSSRSRHRSYSREGSVDEASSSPSPTLSARSVDSAPSSSTPTTLRHSPEPTVLPSFASITAPESGVVDPLAVEMGRIDIDKRYPSAGAATSAATATATAATVSKAVTDTKNKVGEGISKEERMKHVELIRKMLVFVNEEFQKNRAAPADEEMGSEDEDEEEEDEAETHELRRDVEMVAA